MKRCPTCNRTYPDETMSFCLEDGAPLVSDTGGQYSTQPTLVYTGQPKPDTSPQGRASTNPLYTNQPAQNWTQPTMQQPKKRSLLPWILGGAFLLLLGAAGVVVVAAVFIFSSSSNRNRSTTNGSVPGNSNRSNRNGYSNSNNSNNTGYAARKGRYTGTANNTSSSSSTGDAEVEITEINDTTGAMKLDVKFSNGLCGEGKSFGVINKTTGEITSFGSLKSEGSGCPSTTWVITMKCSFSEEDTLKCTYRLTGVGESPQDGNFEVTKE